LLRVWYIFNVKNEMNLISIPDGGITSPRGFSAGATYAGLKKTKDANDLAILFSEVPCTAAAVFTTNVIKAAPVLLDQRKLQKTGQARAVVINSGCANACTGEQGMQDAETTASLTGQKLSVAAEQVMVASTGVIGVNLPMDKIKEGIGRIVLSVNGGHDLARAIMTTDTRPKEIAIKVESDKQQFTIGGVVKGAGMIHPNMATMLCFITTDAAVEKEFLQTALKKAVDDSFNMVSVDGDTSTNDTVLILANGLAGNAVIRQGSAYEEAFLRALNQVSIFLAKAIARDGEGATRLIEVKVNGAESLADARLAARTISNSYLVKSAVHGCDPNWGRIAAAAGRSGAAMIEAKTDVYIGDMCLFKSGRPLSFDKKMASGLLRREEVLILVNLNMGQYSATAWGCDLSEEYVVINSEYTT
jgi:glutamate N-acetyltransferase / amino-acid N-acetyltransferase